MRKCCYTFIYKFFISKIMNHETDLLPLTWKSFLEKLTLNFVNVCISTSNSQFLNSSNIFEAKMAVLEIYFLELENDRKTESSFFNWKFLKVLVLLVTASQQVNLSTVKKTKFTGKTASHSVPASHVNNSIDTCSFLCLHKTFKHYSRGIGDRFKNQK